ncbi:MAG TPA: MraY family glycosyltransferase [Steroidobacteraceae bacterium]|jgi:UDP-GlcNAc:undecaprenyl-phosphate GlcNAc-1-phosphate transferase|nr:MraY family glycosyltransferase [Steroidobacteraceae bacterium]
MPRIAVYFGLPLLVTILFMFALRPLARGMGLIDRPGGRKMHIGEVPVVGGLAMAGGLAVGSLYSFTALQGFPFFLTATALLVFIGALDDRYDLPASVRFLAQICAALLMVAGAGVAAIDIGQPFFAERVELDWLSTPFSIVIVLTAINAFNMFDGSDGVAGIQALIAMVLMGLTCVVGGSLSCLPIVFGLMGCILGFLIFNWPLKRTHNVRAFMGDAGSTMLGFSLAWLSLDLSQGPARVMSPVVSLWIFALPLYDLFSSMVRRLSQGCSPFHGDSEHLHHVLRRLGFSSRQVAQAVLLASSAFGMIGVGGYLTGVPDGWLFTGWAVLGVGYHIVFGSGLVIQRRDAPRLDDGTVTGKYWTLWKQR